MFFGEYSSELKLQKGDYKYVSNKHLHFYWQSYKGFASLNYKIVNMKNQKIS